MVVNAAVADDSDSEADESAIYDGNNSSDWEDSI